MKSVSGQRAELAKLGARLTEAAQRLKGTTAAEFQAALEKIEAAGTALADATRRDDTVGEMPAGERTRLVVNNGQDLEFVGRVIAEYSTQNSAATKPSWHELRLWETTDGNWIAEDLSRSRRSGEVDIRTARVIPAGEVDGTSIEEHERRLMVMDAFGWTTSAKAFAKRAKWDIVRYVD